MTAIPTAFWTLAASLAFGPAVTCQPAGAQAPRGADTLSEKSIADTQIVITELTAHLRNNQRDAAAWTRMGKAAWALYVRARAPGARKLDPTRLGRMADTSLRIAAELQPGNAAAHLTIGDFLLASGLSTSRTAAIGYYRAALTAARISGSDSLHAVAALSLGMTSWRRYDALANRRMSTSISDIGRSLTEAMQPVAKAAQAIEAINAVNLEVETMKLLNKGSGKAADASGFIDPLAPSQGGTTGPSSLASVRNLIESQSMPLPAHVTGGRDLARADSLFDEAYGARPDLPGAFRAAAMVRCERGDWASLERFARAHIARFPTDGHAWLALGLALHRAGDSRSAASAFDTAFIKLPYSEQRRLDRPGRLLHPSSAARVDLQWARARTAFANTFWGAMDPAWSDGISERRVEFRARVAFAEIRWTAEEAGISGADTERGDVYIRYGPPDMVAVFGPNMMDNASDIMTFWMYRSGMIFAFTSMAGFSTARIPAADRAMVDAVKEAQPARWDNVASPRIDSIVTRIAQFRAGPDSVELVLASQALAPSASRIWLMSSQGQITFSDTSVISQRGVASWVVGAFTGYDYLMRIESLSLDSLRRGRFQAYFRRGAAITTDGAGMSDVLVASSVAEAGPSKRWRDAKPTPSVGAIDRGQQLWLLWENYELGADSGSLNYDVTISVKRVRSGAGRIVASVAGALAGVARVNVGDDRADVQYTRTAAESRVVVEAIALDLGSTPAGEYAVTVQVTDRIGKRTLSRSLTLTVRD